MSSPAPTSTKKGKYVGDGDWDGNYNTQLGVLSMMRRRRHDHELAEKAAKDKTNDRIEPALRAVVSCWLAATFSPPPRLCGSFFRRRSSTERNNFRRRSRVGEDQRTPMSPRPVSRVVFGLVFASLLGLPALPAAPWRFR